MLHFVTISAIKDPFFEVITLVYQALI